MNGRISLSKDVKMSCDFSIKIFILIKKRYLCTAII